MSKNLLQIYISRNDFLRFIQCKKTRYLSNFKILNDKEINVVTKNDVSKNSAINRKAAYKHDYGKIFRHYRSAGENKLIEYARLLFSPVSTARQTVPGDIALDQKLEITKQLLKDNTGIIFSGWFEHRGVALFVDILEMRDSWNAYAIRSGGGGLQSNSLDMALQYYILKKNEIDLGAFWAIYINKRYRFNGAINPAQLFRVRDFLPDLDDSIAVVEKSFEEISRPISEDDIKDIDIGNHCFQPSPCRFMNSCWSHIPENSVFEIATLDRALKFQMYQKGILLQKDIKPEDLSELTPNQALQIKSTVNQKTTIRRDELGEFLRKIQYPVHYLDFETFMPVIPLFKDTRPLQHIPFEYCLYVRPNESSPPELKFFLAEASNVAGNESVANDPRRNFIENLLIDLGENAKHGSILVYDSRLETEQLRDLINLYPEFKNPVESIISRIIDLAYPFYKKLYYTPQMKGLYSIKSILPALLPSMSYDNLAIKNGYMAMHGFESLFYETNPDIIAQTRSDLKEYCKMDVLALVEIHKFLENIIVREKEISHR